MDRKELAYAKQGLFGVKDWDVFQAILRAWSKIVKPLASAARWESTGKKGR
jgi:hypothetical protein